jgi:hypothetical protein
MKTPATIFLGAGEAVCDSAGVGEGDVAVCANTELNVKSSAAWRKRNGRFIKGLKTRYIRPEIPKRKNEALPLKDTSTF